MRTSIGEVVRRRRLRFLAGIAVPVLAWLACTAGLRAQQPSTPDARELYAAAMAAYERRDHGEYLGKLKVLASLRPTHPTILYKLAGAYALNGDAEETAGVLRRLAGLSIYRDVTADGDFASVLRADVVRQALESLARARSRRVGHSRVAFSIRDRMLVPEGIAYDRATR